MKPRPLVQSDAPEDVARIREATARTLYAREHDPETVDRIVPLLARLLAKHGAPRPR